MTRFVLYRSAASIAAIALCAGIGSANIASADTVTYKGVTFETQGDGTATVDNGDLLLMPTGNSFGLHVNRLPEVSDNGQTSSINDNDTPFIRFSYTDIGSPANIDVAVQDESATGAPRAAAGSLFAATKAAPATYGSGSERNSNEEYLFYEGIPRTGTPSHDALLARTSDGTLYAGFDGEQRSSDIFKDQGIDFDFNDVTLRARDASGETVRFSDFSFGNDFAPSASETEVPEPGNLLLLGLGLVMTMLLGRRRKQML